MEIWGRCYHIVLGRVASVNNIEKCISRAGLKLNEMILEPIASSRSVLTSEEKEAGVVLVDIGGGTTDVAIFYDGVIKHTAVIPLGGNVVTSDVKEGCGVLQKQAESLKTQFGSALGDLAKEDMVVTIPGMEGWESKEISFKSLAYIIQARMEEIVDYVLFQIESSCLYEKLGAGNKKDIQRDRGTNVATQSPTQRIKKRKIYKGRKAAQH